MLSSASELPITLSEDSMSKTKAKPAATRSNRSPIGSTHRAASGRRARRSAVYREELRRIAPYEGIARMVIARRQALGLTQQELAERIGTSHSAISRIESGQYPTSVTTLRRLAEAFETHLVVGFEDDPDKVAAAELVAVS
jgi:ribosome-binding protein aMBF1 (putative translation factor)